MEEYLYPAFYTTLDTDSELATLERCFGFRPAIELAEKVDTHGRHVPAVPEAMAAARAAFRASYDVVIERFGERVPARWRLSREAAS